MYKVRSDIQIAVTPPWMVRFHSNLVQSFTTSQTIHYKMFEVMTAMDRLSDSKLGMGVVVRGLARRGENSAEDRGAEPRRFGVAGEGNPSRLEGLGNVVSSSVGPGRSRGRKHF